MDAQLSTDREAAARGGKVIVPIRFPAEDWDKYKEAATAEGFDYPVQWVRYHIKRMHSESQKVA